MFLSGCLEEFLASAATVDTGNGTVGREVEFGAVGLEETIYGENDDFAERRGDERKSETGERTSLCV